jgi:chromosome segregation ATPase
MANENKNTKELVAVTDEDPICDLDIHDTSINSPRDTQPEIEVDAQTFAIEDADIESTAQSDAEIRQILRSQARIIDELSFDVEQLRGRRRGLEEELKAREEIATNVNLELQASRAQLNEAVRELESRNEALKLTKQALKKSDRQIGKLDDANNGLKAEAADFKRMIKSLESNFNASEARAIALEKELGRLQESFEGSLLQHQNSDGKIATLEEELKVSQTDLSDLRIYIDGRKAEWSSLEHELAEASEHVNIQRNEAERLAREIDERNSQLVRSREQCISTSEQLSSQKEKVRRLTEKNNQLEQALHQDAKREIAAYRARIAAQTGELAARVHELKNLRKDNERIEQYSDSLRNQLHDQVSMSRDSTIRRHKLKASLDAANASINELEDRLETEQRQNAEYAESIESMQAEFEREVRQIRFELGAAEETLADQHSVNQQLASDLIDNKGFRQALESQLGEVQQENEHSMQKLTTQLRRARQDAEDYERKLHIKNKAIEDLMHELSKYTSKVELRSDVENVLKKIDGFRKDKINTSDMDVRDRVARVLVGNADGRELRFPLFKNRLTIGRTSHNDIQLNMYYVSRRHAVISTDHGQTRVIDWGSKNGVFVNGVQVTERILKSGDTVSIGTAEFRYEERVMR